MNERSDSLPRRARRIGLMAAGLLALTALIGQVALAAPPSAGPPGNNGTVKIHEGPGEPPPEVRNEPHVCTFHLHFFFADPEQAGTWEIQEWAPGDKGQTVLSGTYDTAGDGEDRDPETGVYELPDGHYKLFWDGDLDTNKHDKMKVFWVDCEEGQPVKATPPTDDETPPTDDETHPTSGIQSPTTGGSSPSGLDLGVGGVVTAGGTEVTPPPTDTASVNSTQPANNWPLIVLIIATAVAIASFVMPGRPVRRTSR